MALLDLRIFNFFQWGDPKENVFINRLHTLEDLNDRTREETATMSMEMCENAAITLNIAFISVSMLEAFFLMSLKRHNAPNNIQKI